MCVGVLVRTYVNGCIYKEYIYIHVCTYQTILSVAVT